VDLTLVLTHDCNLRCGYCYTGRKFATAMPLEIASRAIDFRLAQAGSEPLLVSFFGGEPLLEFDLLMAIVEYGKARALQSNARIRFGLSTNGTLLTDGMLDFLVDHDVHIQLSLDGDAHSHDRTRRFADGRASHATVWAHARRLAQAQRLHRIVAVIDPDTAPCLAESFLHLRELGAGEILFSPSYLGNWDAVACAGFEHGLRALGDAYRDTFRAGHTAVMDPLYGKMVTHLMARPERAPRCGFGQRELAVAPSGNIYPCDRLVRQDDDPRMRLGHLEAGIDQAKLARMKQSQEHPDAECQACELRLRCACWCGCAQMETTGRLGEVSPLYCWFERAFIAEADRVAGELWDERNPTFLSEFYRAQPVPVKRAPLR
jgi:uncharacterized protein